MPKPTCSIPGCKAEAVARGWCPKHWTRWRTHGSPETVKQIRGDNERRFRSYLGQPDENGCVPWIGKSFSPRGYGTFYRDGSTTTAHRFAWEMENGPIPEGMMVLHRCDNPPCCNPDHLFLGTHRDNMADMVQKGRAKGGNAAKLTPEQVREIREIYASGTVSMRTLGTMYAVNASTVQRIVRHKRWRSV